MRVIVITSGKGGVGKTTATANIGMALAQFGYQTILLDADIGLRNLDLLLGLENRVVYTIAEVLNKKCRLEQALIKDKRTENLVILPAAQKCEEIFDKEQIIELVNSLQGKFDFVLIDCPAGIEAGFKNAIAAANEAIVISTPEIASVRDADNVIGLLKANNITNIQLIINRLRPKMVKNNDMMAVDDVQDILAIPLLGVIPEDEQVIISTNRGEPLVTEKKLSMPGVAFKTTVQRLLGEKIEINKIPIKEKSLLQKLLFFKT